AGPSPRASTVMGSSTPPYQMVAGELVTWLRRAAAASTVRAAPTEETATWAAYPEPTVNSMPSNIAYAFMSNLLDGRFPRECGAPAVVFTGPRGTFWLCKTREAV